MGKLGKTGVGATQQKIVGVPGGNVYHAMKKTDASYAGFAEAYFSAIEPQAVKAWKRHLRMTMNLVVPVGVVKFVFSKYGKNFDEITISLENYQRLTVPSGIWFGMQGVSKSSSLVLNLANLEHDPSEVEHLDIREMGYQWDEIR